MRCERVRFLYDEYNQGNLPVSTLGRVEEHLAGCPGCREFYDQSDAISALIRKSTEVAHPGPQYFENLHGRVLAALDHPEAEHIPDPAEIIEIPSTQWRRPLWWAGGVAAAALLAVASVPALLTQPVQPIIPQAPITIRPAAPAPQMVAQAPQAQTPIPSWPNKGTTGRNPATIDELIGSIPHYGETERDDLSDAERKANEETQMRMASVRQKIEQSKELPPEVYAQLQLLKAQVIDGRSEDLRRGLRDLESLADPRINDQLKTVSLAKQVKIYSEASDALNAGRTEDAMSNYQRILFIDDQSPIALKASLQMADLFYNELANFSEAQKYYQRCLTAKDKGIFNTTELQGINNRLARLDRYKADNWQALDLLHKIYHGNWDEALGAIRSLTALRGSEALLPEAAQTVLQRMNRGAGEAPSSEITMELYKLLENQAKVQQNVDVRAWLELVLGDIAAFQFQNTEQAIAHYRKAAESGSSDATRQAREKLNDMVNENLARWVRNRN